MQEFCSRSSPVPITTLLPHSYAAKAMKRVCSGIHPWGVEQPILSLAQLLHLRDHQSFASDLPVSLLWGHQDDTSEDLPTHCRGQCNG